MYIEKIVIETEEEAAVAVSIAAAFHCHRTISFFMSRWLDDCFLSARVVYDEIASAITLMRQGESA